jgi:hypothetical protein
VAVDVTVLVAVGVRKHVHALLIFAVKAFPDSLHPATRLLGTLEWSVDYLRNFDIDLARLSPETRKGTYTGNCLFARSSSSRSESFSRFLIAPERTG